MILSLVCALIPFAVGAAPKSRESLYPIQIGKDRRHVVDRSGKPFLIQGEAAWSLIVGLTKEDAETYLEDRRRKGFNSIIVNLIEHQFNGPVDRYGQGPFLTPGDFSTPNEAYFEHADWVIREAAEKGIQVFLAPIYLGYPGTNDGWYKEALANGPEKCRAWGRYVGERYGKFDNIVWLIGGDRNPDEALGEVNAVVEGIKASDARHLFTAHNLEEFSPVDVYRSGGWVDLNSTYSYGAVQFKLLADYNRRPAIPFFLIESVYENEWNASPVQIRRQAYWAVLCGGAGQFMGNRPIWLFDPGWKAALNSVASRDMERLRRLFLSRRWFDLVPDLKHETVLDGLGEFRGFDYLAAARTQDGQTVVAYLPTSRPFDVDMGKVAGKTAKAWWFNPRDGAATLIGEYPTASNKRFDPPGEGDWVLVLDDASANLPAPGKL